ncbi:phosphonate ABC transporter, permease protein PhnE [Paenirhodobacter sp.]|uniref:phosphonate ABC transporter, permease protein PhnE n=1 Tax=Paenirhodobacter sp. TaxID=1965326 RepID=UPI003B508419
MTAAAISPEVQQHFRRLRRTALGLPALVLVYLVYAFFALDVPGLAERFRPANMGVLLGDTWSYKTHVTRDYRFGGTTVAIEGERKGTYPEGRWPEWVHLRAGITEVDLPGGSHAALAPEGVRFDIAGYGTVSVAPGQGGLRLITPDGTVQRWISASDTRVDISAPDGRLSVTRSRAEVFRYAPGWELWFFDLDSPFHYMSWGQIWASLFEAPIRPGMSNLRAVLQDFWFNGMWHHGQVFGALFETLLMAFLGTMGAAVFALPLAFVAARNMMPLGPLRFAIRRVFDFLRGVDGLIWTIVLSRAFGPGPLTGALAILLTDTGSFGKLFSEALENIDAKQVEGLRSTGANALQRGRFGVLPQIAPVILSQVLYFLESNTRGATVIGAIVGGGIGLLLTQAMLTQKDWEEVTYYIVLVLILVMAMDSFSGWLRHKLLRKVDHA